MATMDVDIYVAFGEGFSGQLNDVWKYSTRQSVWTEVVTTSAPSPRIGAAAVRRGVSLYCYGGQLSNGDVTDELHELNTVTMKWSKVSHHNGPSARIGHEAVFLEDDDTMLVYGGQLSGGDTLADVWAFSFTSGTWKQLKPDTAAVAPKRSYFGMQLISDSSGKTVVLVAGGFGDVNGVNFDRWEMTPHVSAGTVSWRQAPNLFDTSRFTTRNYLRVEMPFVGSASEMFVVGGGLSRNFPTTSTDTFYSYSPTNGMNTMLAPMPLPVYNHRAVYFGSTIYAFGGNIIAHDIKRSNQFTNILQQYHVVGQQVDKGVICSIGFYENGTSTCTPCPRGTHKSWEGAGSCIKCPAGSAAPREAAVGSSVCLPCSEGTYQPVPGSSQCLKCPTGQVCPIGAAEPLESSNIAILGRDVQPGKFVPSVLPSEIFIVLGCIGFIALSIICVAYFLLRHQKDKRLTLLSIEERDQIRQAYVECADTRKGLTEAHVFMFLRRLNFFIEEADAVALVLQYDESGTRALDLDTAMFMVAELGRRRIGFAPGAYRTHKHFSFKSFDAFDDAHTFGNDGDVLCLRRNTVGGLVTLFLVVATFALISVLIGQYVWQNVEESRASLPKVVVDSIFESDMKMEFTMLGWSSNASSCVVASTESECEQMQVELKNVRGAGHKLQCHYHEDTICTATWTCSRCTFTTTTPEITLNSLHPAAYAQNITIVSELTTGIPDAAPSHATARISAPTGTVLRGKDAQVFELEATPTAFQKVSELGSETSQTGYHIRSVVARAGSTTTQAEFYTMTGFKVKTAIDVKDTATLVITRREKSTLVTLLSGMLGTVSGLVGFAIFAIRRFDDFGHWRRERDNQRHNEINRPEHTNGGDGSHNNDAYEEILDDLLRAGMPFKTAKKVITAIVSISETLTQTHVSAVTEQWKDEMERSQQQQQQQQTSSSILPPTTPLTPAQVLQQLDGRRPTQLPPVIEANDIITTRQQTQGHARPQPLNIRIVNPLAELDV